MNISSDPVVPILTEIINENESYIEQHVMEGKIIEFTDLPSVKKLTNLPDTLRIDELKKRVNENDYEGYVKILKTLSQEEKMKVMLSDSKSPTEKIFIDRLYETLSSARN